METAHTFTAYWDGPQTINNKLETETTLPKHPIELTTK